MMIPYSLGTCPGVGPSGIGEKGKRHMGNSPSHHALGTYASGFRCLPCQVLACTRKGFRIWSAG